jgi:hypothetical protein
MFPLALTRLLLIAALLICSLMATGKGAPASQAAHPEPRFAFWYEDWKPDTWQKLQPANVFIGVPTSAVAEIHSKRGKALHYVTFYQSRPGTAFLKSLDDLPNVGFHTPQGYLLSVFGGANNYVLCSNSAELQTRILGYVKQALSIEKFDGLFIDNTYLPPASTLVCDAKHSHIKPGDTGGNAYIDLLKKVYILAKQIDSATTIITNPGDPESPLRSDGHTIWDFSDYILWESYGFTSETGTAHDNWKRTISKSFQLAGQPKSRKLLVLSYPRNDAEAFYSYAVAAAFGFEYTANLGVSQQGRDVAGGHYGIFNSRLPRLLGGPLNDPPKPGETVLTRRYRNGICIVNIGTSTYQFTAPQEGILYTETASSPIDKMKAITVLPGQPVIVIY